MSEDLNRFVCGVHMMLASVFYGERYSLSRLPVYVSERAAGVIRELMIYVPNPTRTRGFSQLPNRMKRTFQLKIIVKNP